MARPVSQTRLTKSRSGRAAPLILVVDDSLDARLTWSEYLFEAGYRVAVAADGNEALALALSIVPDLVLLDLEMPGLDGWEAARLMRSYSPTSTIPIVALSGLHDSVAMARAMGAGCDRFVAKPCPPEDLTNIIEVILRERENVRGVV